MAKFPIERAREKLSGRGPSVRAQIDVSTGGQELAQAWAGLGEAIFDMGAREYAMDGKTQADTAEMKARLSMVHFLQDMRKEDDVKKWKGLFAKHRTRVQNLTPKHKGGAARYNAAINKLTPMWEDVFVLQREKKLEDNFLATSIVKVNKLQRAATISNMAEITKSIEAELRLRDKLSYSISRTDTELLLADVGLNVQMSAAEKMALNNPTETLSRIKAGKIEGFDLITEAKDVISIRNMANRTIGLALASQREAAEIQTNAEQGRLMRMAREGTLSDDAIRIAKLPEFGLGSKNTFYKILDAKADAALKEKEDPFKESNPELLADTLDLIRDPDSDITEKDISARVGKGLSVADGDRLITRLDVFKGFWFKRGDMYLKDQLGWSGADVKFLHPEGALSYHLAMDELFTAIEAENLKGADVYKRAKDIAVPHIVDYWEKALMLKGEQLQRLRALLKAKPKTTKPKRGEAHKKRSSLDPEGIW